MRLLLDENLASRELTARLAAAGHDVLPPALGSSDSMVWQRAQAEGAAVVTLNAVVFLALAAAA